MNRAFHILLLALLSCQAFAQSVDEIKGKMNEIKLDEGYFYAEATGEDEKSAFNLAFSTLINTIKEAYISEEKQLTNQGMLRHNMRRAAQRLGFMRGSSYRILVYVSKDDAMGLSESSALNKSLIANAASGQQEQEINEQPITGETGPEEEEVQTTVVTVPTTAPTTTTTPAPTPTPTPSPASTPTPQVTTRYAAVNSNLLKLGDALELKNFLDYYKDSGTINSYGRARSLDDIPDDAYRILIKGGDNTISAILSPANVNVSTNRTDALTDYHGHYIIWYK